VQIDEDGIPIVRCIGTPIKDVTLEALLTMEQEFQQEEDLKRAGLAI
jgi:hypothetical protein